MPDFLSTLSTAALTKHAMPILQARARELGTTCLLDLGPVPVPFTGVFPVFRPDEKHLKDVPRKDILAVSCFALSMLPDDMLGKLIAEARACSDHTLFLDFKFPERNLEYPAALLFMPLRHLISHGRIAERRDMEAFLYKKQDQFSVCARDTLYGGGLCCIVVHNR